MTKTLLLHSIVAGLVISVLLGLLAPQIANAQAKEVNIAWNSEAIVKNDKLTKCAVDKASYGVTKRMKAVITTYTSRPEETDDDPFIAASGKRVFDGMIANNGLPFGTRVRIPSLFGNKVFTVEDRMHKRKGTNHFDIWFADLSEAREFGAKYNITIEVLGA